MNARFGHVSRVPRSFLPSPSAMISKIPFARSKQNRPKVIGVDLTKFPDGIARGNAYAKIKSLRRISRPSKSIIFLEGDAFSAVLSLFSDNPLQNLKTELLGSILVWECRALPTERQILIFCGSKKYKFTFFTEAEHAYWNDWFKQVLSHKGTLAQPLPVWFRKDDTSKQTEDASPLPERPLGILGVRFQNVESKWVSVKECMNGEITMFIMVRHFGCSLCKRTVARILQNGQEFTDLGINICVVGNGEVAAAKQFCEDMKFPTARLYTDLARTLYSTLQFKDGPSAVGSKSIGLFSACVKEGYSNEPGYGSADLQLGGVFTISQNEEIIYQFRSEYIGHEPDFDEIKGVLREYCEQYPDKTWRAPITRGWDELSFKLSPRSEVFASIDSLWLHRESATDASSSVEHFRPNIHNQPYGTCFWGLLGLRPQSIYLCAALSGLKYIVSIKSNQSQAIVFTAKETIKVKLPLAPAEDPLQYVMNKVGVDDYKSQQCVLSHPIATDLQAFELAFTNLCFSAGLVEIVKSKPNFNLKNSSAPFLQFLELLGDQVTLKKWRDFPGNLDCANGTTGQQGLFTEMEDYKIMWNVGCLLEAEAAKRLLYCNPVLVVFLDETSKIDVSMMDNRVACIIGVKKISEDSPHYKIETLTRKPFPPVPPYIPGDPFVLDATLKKFVISKVLNVSDRANTTQNDAKRRIYFEQIYTLYDENNGNDQKIAKSIRGPNAMGDFPSQALIPSSKIAIGEKIAQGGFGMIYQGTFTRPHASKPKLTKANSTTSARTTKSSTPRPSPSPSSSTKAIHMPQRKTQTNSSQQVERSSSVPTQRMRRESPHSHSSPSRRAHSQKTIPREKTSKVAIKQLIWQPTDGKWAQMSSFCQEVDIHLKINHPSLVSFYGISKDPLLLVLEWVPEGTLYDFIPSPDLRTIPDLATKIALDICTGLRYLHQRKPPIIHRDIKSPNILLASKDPQAPVNAKIADFGSAVERKEPFVCGAIAQNPLWVAPEILQSLYYNQSVDIYAFGVVLWEIHTGLRPYAEYAFMAQVEEDVIEGKRMEFPDDVSDHWKTLITKCWSSNPDDRPSARSLESQLANTDSPAADPMEI